MGIGSEGYVSLQALHHQRVMAPLKPGDGADERALAAALHHQRVMAPLKRLRGTRGPLDPQGLSITNG